MNEKEYLVVAQYDDKISMWELINHESTLRGAIYVKQSHEVERDCVYVKVYEARELTDKELGK